MNLIAATKRTIFVMMVCFLLVLCGCAKRGPNTQIDLPDMHIEVDPSGNLPANFWDSYTLFKEADKLFDQERYREAIEVYDKLLIHYPNDKLAPMALFNKGLSLEELGEYKAAEVAYDTLLSTFPKAFPFEKLLFRYAYCYEKTERWNDATRVLQDILRISGVRPIYQTQARARIAVAQFKLGRKDAAQRLLREAIQEYEKYRRSNVSIDSHYYAAACFTLGEYYFEKYKSIELRGDINVMAITLDSKARQFIYARTRYLEAIRTYDHEYMTASLFRIGQGYEHFYFTLLNAPVPLELEPGQEPAYMKKLKEQLAPVFNKALQAYSQALRVSRQLGISNQWVDKAKEREEYLESWMEQNGV